ncbi:MAG: transposase [Planctomycetota bacterium]
MPAVLTRAADAWRATPLWAAIHEGTDDADKTPKTVRIVNMAQTILAALGQEAYLVLDAYSAVGPVFAAAKAGGGIHILTRAKRNYVAYRPPPPPRKHGKAGRHKKYGAKLHLNRLFDMRAWKGKFVSGSALVYDRRETVRFLVLDLLWKPVNGSVRFILVVTSRGPMILMSSDLHLDPIAALELYCRRVPIETLFNTLKNTFGAFAYHFWSSYLAPASRRPAANPKTPPLSANPPRTRDTLAAIEKFVNLQLLVLGFLQLLAFRFPNEVRTSARCRLRTVSRSIPSEFVTRLALVNIIRPAHFAGVGLNWISALIAPGLSAPYDKLTLDKRLG